MAEDDRTFRTPAANRGRTRTPEAPAGGEAAPVRGAEGGGDNPQDDWGESGDEGLLHSANHSRRPIKTEAERSQGAKTRQLNKDIVSRRV
jgi:hypothetical protein